MVPQGARRQDIPGEQDKGDVPGGAAVPAVLPRACGGGRHAHCVPQCEEDRPDTRAGAAAPRVGGGQDEGGGDGRGVSQGKSLRTFSAFLILIPSYSDVRKWTQTTNHRSILRDSTVGRIRWLFLTLESRQHIFHGGLTLTQMMNNEQSRTHTRASLHYYSCFFLFLLTLLAFVLHIFVEGEGGRCQPSLVVH